MNHLSRSHTKDAPFPIYSRHLPPPLRFCAGSFLRCTTSCLDQTPYYFGLLDAMSVIGRTA
eukprot:EC723351.1.p4 GENE.EC723351.1~~EC723351.1.p4  ORF type:complete len:61 (+),score=1.02 EC723351.1:248-430(+)